MPQRSSEPRVLGHSTPFLCYSGCLGSLGEDALGAATTIVNAKVFDGTKSQDWTSVRFADGLITTCSAASAAQEGDEVIDAGGGTVLSRGREWSAPEPAAPNCVGDRANVA